MFIFCFFFHRSHLGCSSCSYIECGRFPPCRVTFFFHHKVFFYVLLDIFVVVTNRRRKKMKDSSRDTIFYFIRCNNFSETRYFCVCVCYLCSYYDNFLCLIPTFSHSMAFIHLFISLILRRLLSRTFHFRITFCHILSLFLLFVF